MARKTIPVRKPTRMGLRAKSSGPTATGSKGKPGRKKKVELTRGQKAWETRRANLKAKRLMREDGTPMPKLVRMRREIALRAWATRNEQRAAPTR